MTDTVRAIANEPDGAPRLPQLDILRGIAILGILFMNINDMGASLWASFGDVRHLGWTAADQAAWFVRELLADGTARGMLQFLFGAGMMILTDRAAERLGERMVLRRYYARNAVLLLFGLIHVFILLWPGDILHTYAIAAMAAALFRRLPPRLLLLLGLSMTLWNLVGGSYGLYQRYEARAASADAVARRQAGTPLTQADRQAIAAYDKRAKSRAQAEAEKKRNIAEEDAARTGTFISWAGSAWAAIRFTTTSGLELLFVWESAAAMLIGAALYRWGVIQGRRSRRFYGGMMLAGYAIGLPLRAWSAAQTMAFDGGANIDEATYELARLATTIGHLGLVSLLVGTVIGRRLLAPFSAAGRTALSIYIAQTLICLWLLYPPFALALYGQQGWASLMLTALAIDAALLALAIWWVRRFAIAPVEWAWRSLVERRRLPFRRSSSEARGAIA